jgi:hypothetical protein
LPLSRTCSPVARLPHNTRLSFEALFHGAIRTSKSVVGLRRRRSPLRFCLLQVVSSASRGHAITAQSLRSWPSSPVCSPLRCRRGARPAVDLQRVSDSSAGVSSPSAPTCSRFVPSDGPFTLASGGPIDEACTTGT